MITSKINLTKLIHIRMTKKGKDGNPVEGIFIPIDKNNLKRSTKEGYNNVYLDLVAFKLKTPNKNDSGNIVQTHLVKQSLDKETREAMSEQEKNDQPIIGGLANYDDFTGEREDEANDAGGGKVYEEEDDDLPF